MKRYTIDLNDKRYIVDIQDIGDDTYRVLVGDRWYNAKVSAGREVGQDWDIVERDVASIAPVINITMPEQQPPVVNVNIPEQAAPIVNVAPADVTVSIPDINLRAGSIAKVKRDHTGKIVEIDSTAQVVG